MRRSNKTFRDKLIDIEKPDAAQRKRYEKEVQVPIHKIGVSNSMNNSHYHILMLVFVGLYLIIRALYRLEFKTREKLLEIELHLIELHEKIENRRSE